MIEYYSPDEDSYTLLDCIIDQNITDKMILDLGTSTGIIYNSLHKANLVIGSDLNMKALKRQPRSNNLIRMDLLSCVRQECLDIIIFNPPYVLYSDDPIIGGGVDGRYVIDMFIRVVTVRLFYLLVIEANKYKEIIRDIEERGYKVEILRVRQVLREKIIILKCTSIDEGRS